MTSSRVAPIAALLAVTLLCWLWIVPMARDMYGPMTGWSAWMMTPVWSWRHIALLWLMWAVMMAAMMLPSAMPLLSLYDRSLRTRGVTGSAALSVYAMAGGYLLAWAGFSVGATALQRLLARAFVLNPMMEMPDRAAVGTTLLVAGAWQLTPWKASCLQQCRTPLAFIMQRWRTGIRGALRMGLEHGAYCLGCCWALMLLLFAGCVMNLTVIVGLTAIVLIEKISPFGLLASRVLGVVLILAGAWCLLT